jgi:hypothetical protein
MAVKVAQVLAGVPGVETLSLLDGARMLTPDGT